MLTTREFLTAIWPAEGPYCIARPFLPKGAEKPVYAQTAFDDMDDAIQYIMQKRKTDDIYFAIHTLKVARQPNPANNGKLKTFRTHENMKEARAFFFDLDVGTEAHKYASQADALAALERFLFAVPALHRPIITSSGNGLHVYWTITDPLPSEAWRDIADKLHWLALHHHLKVDPTRTTDQSSVLRVVNTFNYKDKSNPRKVEALAVGEVMDTDHFVALITMLVGDQYVPVTYLAPALSASQFPSPVGWDGRMTPADELVETCEYIREFRDKQGNVSEPYWHAVLGALKYADDGERVAHDWSSGYPRYSYAETQQKLDLWKTGPASCAKLKTACGGDACTRCPLTGTGKNPLDIANKAWAQRNAPAPVLTLATQQTLGEIKTVIDPPYPYQRTPAGIIRKMKDDDETDPTKKRKFVRICDYDIFPVQQFDGNKETPGFSRWVANIPLTGQRVIEIQNSNFEARSLHQALMDENIIVDGKMINEVRDFMLAYLKSLQRKVSANKQYDYLGWEVMFNKDDMPASFILHSRKIMCDTGEVVPCAMSKTMNGTKDFLGKAGTLAKQIELLKFYRDPSYIPHQFAILASLGTPFFRFTNQHGVVINLSGETGVSKSTAVYTAASLWGHPELYPIAGTPGGSTKNARDDRGMMLANLPLVIDEITLMEPADARSFVLGGSQPGGKQTMTADRALRVPRGGLKSNMTICSANSSLHQLINTSNVAGQASTVRVFEIFMRRDRLMHQKWEADKFVRDLSRNYGWIGEAVLQDLLPYVDSIEAKIIKEMARLDALLQTEPSERFWTAACAVVLVIGRMTRKLGYHDYDVALIEDWIVNQQFPYLRGQVTHELQRRDPSSILMDYIESIHGETVRVELDKNNQIAGIVKVPETGLKAHFDITHQEMWVRIEPFRSHCEREGHPFEAIMTALTSSGLIKNRHIRKTMGDGTSGQKGRTFCFIVDLTHKDVRTVTPAPAKASEEPADDPINVVPFPKKKGGSKAAPVVTPSPPASEDAS